jgi:hypothetical protein
MIAFAVAGALRSKCASITLAFVMPSTTRRWDIARSSREASSMALRAIVGSSRDWSHCCYRPAEKRGLDTTPVKCSLQGDHAKTWIVEPKDDSHLNGAPSICCHQWSGPGACAPIAKRLEVKGAWLDSKCNVVVDPTKEDRARQIHDTGFT